MSICKSLKFTFPINRLLLTGLKKDPVSNLPGGHNYLLSELSIHTVVADLKRDLECLEEVHAYIETVNENGHIVIQVDEDHEDLQD